jgi:hypothetical protein
VVEPDVRGLRFRHHRADAVTVFGGPTVVGPADGYRECPILGDRFAKEVGARGKGLDQCTDQKRLTRLGFSVQQGGCRADDVLNDPRLAFVGYLQRVRV